VYTQRLIMNPLAILSLALFFVFTGAENLFFFSDSVFIGNAEAKGKDKDKDKDDDGGYVFNQDKFSVDADCSQLKKLQIKYDKEFTATEDAPAPNILVVGAEGNTCSITIEKIAGGNKCGFKVGIKNKVLEIDTKAIDKAKNCEMCIKVVVPREVNIKG